MILLLLLSVLGQQGRQVAGDVVKRFIAPYPWLVLGLGAQ